MKTVICGLWHVHAEEYYQVAAKYTEVCGVYEENEAWRKEFCEKHNLHEFQSMEELLKSDADAAIVCTSTDIHTDTIIRLADAGKHIFTEKVLALTTEECEQIQKAIEKNGVKFVISLPHKYLAAQRTVKSIVDSKELGKINFFRYRNVHNGSTGRWLPPHFYDKKQCGGGAMIDLGAHGMYLTDWLLGMPVSAKSVFTVSCSQEETLAINPDGVEDNAVTVMQYENGCIAINETGFVSIGYPQILEIGGENGIVRMINGRVEKNTAATEGRTVEVPLLEGLPLPIEQFCTDNILEGCGIEEAKKLTRLMEMAYSC